MVFRFYIIVLIYWQDLSRLHDMSLSVNAIFIANAPILNGDSFLSEKYNSACELFNQSRLISRSTHEGLQAVVHSYAHAYTQVHLPIYDLKNIVAFSRYI